MDIDNLRNLLQGTKDRIEMQGLKLCYMIVYDPGTAKFAAIAADDLPMQKERLIELRDYAVKTLETL